MHKIYDFFISHSEKENDEAQRLYNLLHEINPEWEIFFDKRCLGKESEWASRMYDAAQYSKHLIFLAQYPETLEFGHRWVSKEVEFFYNLQSTRKRSGTGKLNISYFGIIYGWNMEKDLFSDSEYGALYRAMYTAPNHLIINQNDSVTDYFNSIKEKVLTMTEQSRNPIPAYILDCSLKYAKLKQQEDVNFKKERIIDILIPELSVDENIKNFDQMLSSAQNSHIAILGNEGGIGKTTIMTKMFFELQEKACVDNSDDSLIPIYIKGSALAGSDYIIMRYIAKNYFGESTATSFDSFETGNIIKTLESEFKADTETPNYILLIDGYNEIPESVLSKFNEEINQYLSGDKYKNVRIVISGRYLSENFSREGIIHYTVKRIAFSKVRAYLDENGLNKTIKSSLMNVLSIPMYLTMYVDMALEEKINNRAELLNKFVERQIIKDSASANGEIQSALYNFLISTLLPYVAYRLSVRDSSKGNFELTFDEMCNIMADALDYYNSREYKSRCGEDGRRILRLTGISNMDEYDLVDLAIEYYTKVCKLLRVEVNGTSEKDKRYDFIHQVYRDFFAATYIYEDIKYSTDAKIPCVSLESPVSETDIYMLISELLNEKSPYFDIDNNCWNYSCNDESALIQLLDNSRKNGQNQNAEFVSAVVNLLRLSRNYDLSGCDFSDLDLTKSNFCSVRLTRSDINADYGSSFKNSKINSENLLTNTHESYIMAACTGKNTVAVFDASGVLKIWNKGKFDNNPLKVISGITYNLHKIIYSSDEKIIYAMSGHTILQIDIPESKFGSGFKVIYSTGKRLRNIFIDKNGELAFTTVFNSYNPKPISNPELADEINFYGVNSASAVRDDKMQLAFCYVAGFSGFRLYDYDIQKNEWKETKTGIYQLMDEYVGKIEIKLKNSGVYDRFYNQKEKDAKYYFNKLDNYRCTFFKNLVFKYNKETSDYTMIPQRIINSVINKIKSENMPVPQDFIQRLLELNIDYKSRIYFYLVDNRAMAYLHGRKISNMEYKPGTDILLLTYYNDYVSEKDDKHYYHTTVAELNTTDLTAKIIHTYTGHNKIRAMYSGDDIVIQSSDKLWIVQPDGNIYSIPVIFSNVCYYFSPQESSVHYMVTNFAVYQLNSDFVCERTFIHNCKTGPYYMYYDENGVFYMISGKNYHYLFNNPERPVSVLNLQNGKKEFTDKKVNIIKGVRFIENYFGKSIHNRFGRINLYKDNILHDTVSLQRAICISGCDFTGISGTLNDSEYTKILKFYGAKTDEFNTCPVSPEKPLDFAFAHSNKPFEQPDEIINAVSPYIKDDNLKYTKESQVTEKSTECEIWGKIQKGSYKKDSLEPSDYSILERAYDLQVITPEIVYYLMGAGLVEMPSVYSYSKEKIAKRMYKTLFGNLRLIKRYIHSGNSQPMYILNDCYGKKLLSSTSGTIFNKEPMSNNATGKVSKNIVLNLWFSYMLMKYKDCDIKYDSDVTFDSEVSLIKKNTVVRRYIKLNDQAFFARIIRGEINEAKIQKNRKRISYFCDLASNYPYLQNKGVNLGLTKPPVIVIIGESFESCQKLDEALRDISPHIRRIYTYDTLLMYGIEKNNDDIYFEFAGSKPYVVKIADLI